MKANLLYCFLLCHLLSFGQTERALINKIDSINEQALYHYRSNELVKSFNAFNTAIKLSDSIKDHYGNAVANFTIGKIYNYMQDDNKAEVSYTRAIQASRLASDNFILASSYLNLGKMFMRHEPPTKAIPYLEKALYYTNKHELRDQNNKDCKNEILFETHIILAKLYLEISDTQNALIYLSKAERDLKYINDQGYSEAQWNLVFGEYCIYKELYNSASMKLNKAAALLEQHNVGNAENKKELLSAIYEQLSTCYAWLENDSRAYQTLLIHNTYKDELLNEERIRQDIIAKSKLSIENYKNAAQLANSERIEQLVASNKIKNVNIIISIMVFLLGISLLTMYKSYSSKRKLSDILKARNKELELAKNEAEKSSELKSNFISNVTHELRTPLYGVVGLTSILLKNNSLSSRDTKFLKSLKYSGDYLLNLVNDVLQIEKIESQKIELKNVTVNIRLLIENLVNSFDYRLEETNNELQISIDKYIPEFIKCDNVRLSQVLINLIGNSIKFTENGKIHIRILHLNTVGDYVSLRFEIEDNGPGIPKEKQKTIFENFSQLDDNSNTNYQGTGLGLPISKNIIELFGSVLEVESEVNTGTIFSFELTFDIEREAKANVRKVNKTRGRSTGLNRKYKILVAEDNKINQIVTQNLLHKENYECVIAKNGQEAVEFFETTHFDLILMDINMPIMHGNEATKIIRASNANVPIIALTAADIEEVKGNYQLIGYDDVITKPFDNYEFFQTVSEHIEKYKSIHHTELNEPRLVKVS
ncbi:MAG: response regulator [Algicola sp.]|nr:response regulator [Algicola sp.]